MSTQKRWTDTTEFPNLVAPDDADLLPIADMSLAEGSRQSTMTVGTLRALAGGGGSPGGSDTQIQYNDGGAFAGLAGFMLQKANPRMRIEKTLAAPITGEVDDAVHINLIKGANASAVPSALHVYAHSADAGAGTGNLHAISSHINDFDPTNATDEATPLFTLMTAQRGRLWGTDQNVVGPSATQAHTILGASVNVMNQNAGAATGKVVGINVTTVKNAEAQAVAPTHPGDYGILVNGRSGDGATTRAGWTVGIGVGQAGGGWHAATVGKITTGVEVTNVDTLGISYVGTVAASVGLRLRGHASQSGDLLQVRTSDDITRFRVLPTGEPRVQMAARSVLSFVSPGEPTIFGRIGQQANTAPLYVTDNAYFDGSAWQRDDGGRGSALLLAAAGAPSTFQVRYTPAGAGAITWGIPFQIGNGKNVVVGDAALATSATDGFLYIPTTAGNPTGAPTAYTGTAAMVLDSTNNRLYVRNGATWRYATLT